MSEIEIEVPAGPAPSVPVAFEADVSQEPAAPAPPTGSIVSGLRDEVAQQTAAGGTKTLRVGRLSRLWAAYRPLTDEERGALEQRVKHRAKLRDKVAANEDKELAAAALLLATACVELLYLADDGSLRPLHEALAEQGAETHGPLRYNAETVELLGLAATLALGPRPESVEVVMALHRWGPGNHAPLLTTARLLGVWMSAVSSDALEGVLEGS